MTRNTRANENIGQTPDPDAQTGKRINMNFPRARRAAAATLCLAMIPLAACVRFKEQTLVYKHIPEQDQLILFLNYQGIHGSRNAADPSHAEKEELASVMTTERAFFFNNWIWEYHRQGLEEETANIKERLQQPDDQEKRGQASRTADQRSVEFFQLLFENVRVENGRFYLDDQNRLCGYQSVRVDKLSKVLASANRFISAQILEELDTDKHTFGDSRTILRRAAEHNHPWIAVDGNRFDVNIPISREDLNRLRIDIASKLSNTLEQLRQGNTEDAELLLRNLDLLMRNQIWINYARERLDVSIGYVDEPHVRLRAELSGDYVPNLLPHVKNEYGVVEELDIEEIQSKILSP